MTVQQITSEIVEEEGALVGPYRRPRNMYANVRGSIHNDATAQNLGLRGRPRAGSIPMAPFPPILSRPFGARGSGAGARLPRRRRRRATDAAGPDSTPSPATPHPPGEEDQGRRGPLPRAGSLARNSPISSRRLRAFWPKSIPP